MEGLLKKMPPFGVQMTDEPNGRPERVYPEDRHGWPGLKEKLNAEVEIKDGKVLSDALGGKAKDYFTENISIKSDIGKKNGIIIRGENKFVLADSNIEMSGDASNDFECIGAAVSALSGSNTVVKNTVIKTSGLVKSCTTAAEKSNLYVYDSKLECNGGTLPEGYVNIPGPGGMLTPPPGLGIGGTARAHLSMYGSKTYFKRCEITSEGWAALSTDASDGYVYLEADDCDIVVKNAGYGIYSDGDCHVVLKNSRVNTLSHTAIMAGECTGRFEDVKAVSGKYFIMIHNVMGIPEEIACVAVDGGDISTGEEAFYLKSCNSHISIRGAKIHSRKGILARAIVNDDECKTDTMGKDVFGNNMIIADSELCGDIINDDDERVLSVYLTGTKLEGGLNNVHLSLDESSRWFADKDSVVAITSETYKNQIDAAAGVTIKAYVFTEGDCETISLPSGGKLEIINPNGHITDENTI
ncbi:MAG: hypothetical protein K6G40_10070 [Eubacterium sp.]|nr:hypothetical protein [Eubacterium sp.]